MFGKVAGLFNVFGVRGEKMDQGAMVRYLCEMIWFPIAFLGQNISWLGVDDHSAQVTFTDGGKSVSARLVFDGAGRPTNFIAQRYRGNKGDFSLDTWSAPCPEYEVRAGLNLPIRGQAMWNQPSGDLPYVELELAEVEYNCPIESF